MRLPNQSAGIRDTVFPTYTSRLVANQLGKSDVHPALAVSPMPPSLTGWSWALCYFGCVNLCEGAGGSPDCSQACDTFCEWL